MDERQQQIKAGAGLEEGRINQDLVDFLQKWGSWILMALAVAALAYAGLQWLERQRVAKVNEAFAAFEGAAAGANPSPDALRRVADEYDGVESVAELARLTSADIFMDAVRMGVRTGAQVNADGSVGQVGPDGSVNAEGELLTEEERGRYLEQARALYGAVLEATRGKPGRELLAINASFGLAAVAETRGEIDAARAQLESVAALAEELKLPAMVRLARSRIEALDPSAPALLARAQLPELPKPPEPEIPEPDASTPQDPTQVPPVVGGADDPEAPREDAAPSDDAPADETPATDDGGGAPPENPDQP